MAADNTIRTIRTIRSIEVRLLVIETKLGSVDI
jgi:hypothetical protein